jgi:uncharacterized protein (TIGR03435 family)
MLGRIVLLPILLLPLAAQAPTWQEFSIGPATRLVNASFTNLRQGMLHSGSISLQALVGLAAGVVAERVAGPPWMARDHYAISATLSEASRLRLRTREPDDARVVDEFRSLLMTELVNRFQLESHRETRDTLEYALRPSDSGVTGLHPPTPGERANLNVSDAALAHRSTLEARGITLRGFGGWLSNHLKTPVTVADSLPEGPHSFQVQWKTGDDESLFAALKSQLGLQLVKEQQRQEYVVVDRVERPGGPPPTETREPTEPVKAAPDSAVTFTVVQLRKDLRILREALEEGHPGIYRFTPKAEMDRAFDRASAQLTRPMTALEFYRLAAPLVALLKCGHTALRPSGAIEQRVVAEPLLPIEAAVLGGRVYVARDFSANGTLAGAQILSINGVAVEQILARMLAVVHGDGDSATAGPYRLSHSRGFARNLYLIAGLQSPFRLRYVAGGKTLEAEVNGVPLAAMAGNEVAVGNATWRVPGDGSAGVLKIKSFGGNAEGGAPMALFMQNVFTEIGAKGIQRLILDLRDNGGGEDELGRKLFAYFASAPFRYYRDLIVNKLSFRFFQYVPERDSLPATVNDLVKPAADGKLHVVGHPNWGTQQPAVPHFGGKLVVLMNGGSFSTTCEFLATLHNRGGATFIGQETAGGYYGNTSGASATLRLPASKMNLPVQLVGYYMAIEGAGQGSHGIRPDHTVEYSIGDILAGHDLEMEMALRLAAQ